jgi:surface antigen
VRHRAILAAAILAALLLASIVAAIPAGAVQGAIYLCGPRADYGCTGGGYQGRDPWGYWQYGSLNQYGRHNCTSYAAFRADQNGARNPGNLGDAKDWDDNARGYGIPVDGTPAVGAIAQWNAGVGGTSGHVAYVEEVGSDYIITSDDNFGYNTTSRQKITRTSGGWPSSFIHLKDLPNGSPFGSFDGATGRVGGAVQVSGWTIDPDAPTTPTAVHVYIDGPAGSGARGVNLGLADVPRPDVGAANPGAGNNHGFNTTITGVSPGIHTLYAYAINAAGGGANPLLRTLQATVPGPDPIGRLDSAHGAVGGLSASTAGRSTRTHQPPPDRCMSTLTDPPARAHGEWPCQLRSIALMSPPPTPARDQRTATAPPSAGSAQARTRSGCI